MILAAGCRSGSPTLANELLLPAIAAVIVGGTAITGGVGSVWRTLIGALIISVVRIGMTFVGVNIFAQQIVFGARADPGRRHHHRPQQDPDRQIEGQPMDLGLKDKVAVITGGSVGIGLAVAHGLAAEGAQSSSPRATATAPRERAREVAAAHGVRALAIAADVSTAEGCAHLVGEVERRSAAATS